VWKIPDDMPSLIATLLDPTAVAVRALELSQREPGAIEEALDTNSKVVILGAGPIGLLTALVLRIMGVEKIIMIDGYVSKLNMAKEVANVDETINFNEVGYESRISMVREMTNGGADLVVQCANSTAAFVEGLEMIRRLGTLVEVGNIVSDGHEVGIDPARLVCSKHARIIGMSANHPGAFNKAFHILMRHEKYAFDKLFTHICKLEELPGALKKMKDQDYVKGVVVFEN
jgi:threonine dehydrogenase-like Zn-dependent dehydrogenase